MKKMMGFLFVFCLILVLAACSQTNENSSAAPSDNQEDTSNDRSDREGSQAEKNVTLSVILNQSWNKETFEPMMKAYESENPNVKLDLQIIPDNQFGELLNTKIVTNEVPDVIWYTHGGLSKIIDMSETLVALDHEPWVSRLENPDAAKHKGKLVGLPSNATGAPIGIVYNKTLFEELNLAIPQTYEEFLQVCESIKAAGTAPILAPFKDTWTLGMWHVATFPNVVKNDPDLTWDNLNRGEVKYSDVEGFQDVIEMLKEMNDKGYFNENPMSTTYDMGKQMMADGEVAMIMMGDYFIADAIKLNPDFEYGLFPFPITENASLTSGNIQMFSIFKSSDRIEESKRLLQFLAEVEQQKQINKDWNNIPAFKDVEIELPYWIQDVIENYINKENPPILQMGLTIPTGVGELATATQDMLSGGVNPEEVLKIWDEKYAQMAKERKLPGWE